MHTHTTEQNRTHRLSDMTVKARGPHAVMPFGIPHWSPAPSHTNNSCWAVTLAAKREKCRRRRVDYTYTQGNHHRSLKYALDDDPGNFGTACAEWPCAWRASNRRHTPSECHAYGDNLLRVKRCFPLQIHNNITTWMQNISCWKV